MVVGIAHSPESIAQLERALKLLDGAAAEPQPASNDDPVFVAGLGWRTGSTLIQRALMTDPTILVWGEPMEWLLYLDRLTEPLFAVTDQWPPTHHWISNRPDVDLARDWIAILSPDAGYLKAGYRAFFDQWLALAARKRGFQRWGVKQVRWSGAHAMVLRWLYPRSQFLLVVRHPVTTYLSMRNSGFEPPVGAAIVRWPDRGIATLDEFGQFWNGMALSWAAVLDKLGVSWVRYEDVVERRTDLNAVGRALGLQLESDVALDSNPGTGTRQIEMSIDEINRINELTAPGRDVFSYAE